MFTVKDVPYFNDILTLTAGTRIFTVLISFSRTKLHGNVNCYIQFKYLVLGRTPLFRTRLMRGPHYFELRAWLHEPGWCQFAEITSARYYMRWASPVDGWCDETQKIWCYETQETLLDFGGKKARAARYIIAGSGSFQNGHYKNAANDRNCLFPAVGFIIFCLHGHGL